MAEKKLGDMDAGSIEDKKWLLLNPLQNHYQV